MSSSIDPNFSFNFFGTTSVGETTSSPTGAGETTDSMGSAAGNETAALRGGMSLVAFYDAVNKALSESKKNEDKWQTYDALLHKNLYIAASISAAIVRSLLTAFSSFVDSSNMSINQINTAIANYNAAVQSYNAGLAAEKVAVDTLNSAVAAYTAAQNNYNNASSPYYHDAAYLQNATSTYQAAVDSYNSYATQRNTEIAAYEQARQTYNAAVADYNNSLASSSQQSDQYQISSTPLTTIDGAQQSLAILNYQFTGTLSYSSSISGVDPLVPLDSALLLEEYMASLINSLSSFRTLLNEVDLKKVSKEREDYLTRLLLGMIPALFNYHLNTTVFTGSNSTGATGLGAASGLQDQTLDSLFARALLDAAASSSTIVPPRTFNEMQLGATSLLSNSELQAATGPAFGMVGGDLGKTSTGKPSIALALSFATTARVLENVTTGLVRQVVASLVSDNPELVNLPEGEQRALIEQLSATMSLSLVMKPLLNAAITLGMPALVTQLFLQAGEHAGIDPNPVKTSLSSLLNDRTLALLAAAGGTIDVETLMGAYGRASSAGPYQSIEQFTAALAGELQAMGLSPQAAEQAAIRFSGSLATLGAAYPLTGKEGDAPFSLAGVSNEALENAVAATAADFNIPADQLQAAVNDLLELAQPAAIQSYSPLSFSGPAAPPTNVGQAEAVLVHSLRQHGVGAEVGLNKAAKQLIGLISQAPELGPLAFDLSQRLLEKAFSDVGIDPSRSKEASREIASTLYREAPNTLTNLNTPAALVQSVQAARAEQLGAITGTLVEENPGLDPRLAASIAEELVMQPPVAKTVDSFTALLSKYFSPEEARALAERFVEQRGEGFIAQRLIDQGLPEAVAGQLNGLPLPLFSLPSPIDPSGAVNQLVRGGLIADDRAASLTAGVAAQLLHTPGAYDGPLAFQVELVRALAQQTGLSSSAIVEALPPFKEEGATVEETFKEVWRERFAAAGAPQAVQESAVSDLPFSQFVNQDALGVDLAAALINQGKVSEARASEIANQAVIHLFMQPVAYVSGEDFRSALRDVLYILGVNPQAAKAISSTLSIDGVFEAEAFKAKLLSNLAGVSPNIAQGYVAFAMLNPFKVGSGQIDLDSMSLAIQEEIMRQSTPEASLMDAILSTPTAQQHLEQGGSHG